MFAHHGVNRNAHNAHPIFLNLIFCFRAAGSVAAYWNERRGGFLRPGIPGYNTAMSLVSLGFALGGRLEKAEEMATYAFEKEKKVCGGISTWTLAHVYDAEGRTAEGISTCANSDGSRHFEECGFLFFDSMLFGYGVRFALDREERGRGRSKALRLYDSNYERIFEYTGFSQGQLPKTPLRKAPIGWSQSKFDKKPKSFISEMFGKNDSQSKEKTEDVTPDGEIIVKAKSLPSINQQNWQPTVEDVLTWLPPTPRLLTDATLLMLRLTLNGTISTDNYRWENLRNAWSVTLDIQQRFGEQQSLLAFYPLGSVAASLMISTDQTLNKNTDDAVKRLSRALHKMGNLLNVGHIDGVDHGDVESEGEEDESDDEESSLATILFRDIVADKQPDFWLPATTDDDKAEWKRVLNLLSSSIDGVYNPLDPVDMDFEKVQIGSEFQSWEFDARPFLEHCLVFAACKCGDHESLSLARSVCSRGVTLRPNSPEEWWRYSIVLGLLGDEVASEHAYQATISLGSGQGARGE